MECKVSIEAQQDDQQGLQGMNNQGKQNGMVNGDAKLHKYYLDGKMPGTGSVGSGYKYGNGYHAEGEQSRMNTEMTGKGKGEESEIEMQEIAYPYGYRENHEERGPLHFLDGYQSL